MRRLLQIRDLAPISESCLPPPSGTGAGVLGLKDVSRAFPTNSSLGVLKWRFQTVSLFWGWG
eukprot:scaffold7365_cov67-Isochrysis_galbana.AAC.2